MLALYRRRRQLWHRLARLSIWRMMGLASICDHDCSKCMCVLFSSCGCHVICALGKGLTSNSGTSTLAIIREGQRLVIPMCNRECNSGIALDSLWQTAFAPEMGFRQAGERSATRELLHACQDSFLKEPVDKSPQPNSLLT